MEVVSPAIYYLFVRENYDPHVSTFTINHMPVRQQSVVCVSVLCTTENA